MKLVIAILVFVGAAALFSGITGIQRIHGGLETTIVYDSTSDRIYSIVIGALALLAAHACKKKKVFGWWMVAGMIVFALLSGVWGVIRVLSSDAYLALSWLAQSVFVAALLYWWMKQKKYFGIHEERA